MVEPRRPPNTNVGTETAFRHDHCKLREPIQKVNISEVRGQLILSNSRTFSTISNYMLIVTDFDPKGTIPRSEFTLALNVDILGAGRSPNAGRNYTDGFRNWPPATCRFSTRRSFDHHGKWNDIKEFRNLKVKLVRISHWSESDENAKTTARLPVTVSSEQTWF